MEAHTMPTILVFAAFLCALIAEFVALGADLFGSTWEQWVAGALLAFFLAQFWPWVEARR